MKNLSNSVEKCNREHFDELSGRGKAFTRIDTETESLIQSLEQTIDEISPKLQTLRTQSDEIETQFTGLKALSATIEQAKTTLNTLSKASQQASESISEVAETSEKAKKALTVTSTHWKFMLSTVIFLSLFVVGSSLYSRHSINSAAQEIWHANENAIQTTSQQLQRLSEQSNQTIKELESTLIVLKGE